MHNKLYICTSSITNTLSDGYIKNNSNYLYEKPEKLKFISHGQLMISI